MNLKHIFCINSNILVHTFNKIGGAFNMAENNKKNNKKGNNNKNSEKSNNNQNQ